MYICLMLRKITLILIYVSILVLQGHDMVMHHHTHEDEQALLAHEEDGHNLFFLVDIDEDYTLQNCIDSNIPFIAIVSTAHCDPASQSLPIHWHVNACDHPPPKPDLTSLPLRAPPVSFLLSS
jgi:hypothetical protein